MLSGSNWDAEMICKLLGWRNIISCSWTFLLKQMYQLNIAEEPQRQGKEKSYRCWEQLASIWLRVRSLFSQHLWSAALTHVGVWHEYPETNTVFVPVSSYCMLLQFVTSFHPRKQGKTKEDTHFEIPETSTLPPAAFWITYCFVMKEKWITCTPLQTMKMGVGQMLREDKPCNCLAETTPT